MKLNITMVPSERGVWALIGRRSKRVVRHAIGGLAVIASLVALVVPQSVSADANETSVGSAQAGDQASITVGDVHTCAVLSAGAVKCWGSNSNGQLGDGSTVDKRVPTDVQGLTSGVTAVSAGVTHTCALLSTGAVKCWGGNEYGQLGDNTTVDKHVPTDVQGLSSGVTAISAGGFHTCALLSTGAMKCWGWGESGQLGDNTLVSKLVPTNVQGLSSGVTAISAGRGYTCALLSTANVKCWGYNIFGQLGDNTTVQKSVPTDVVGINGSGQLGSIKVVSAAGNHTCALGLTGEVYCWGRNNAGSLGDNSTVDKLVPVGVTGNYSALTSGVNHTCARLSNGALRCWGGNAAGQLGDNSTVDRLIATDVVGVGGSGVLSDVTAVTAGNSYSCARFASGAISCWGYNQSGQLGDGTVVSRSVSSNVVGLVNTTVTFDANGGSGTMPAQTAALPTALSANGFTRAEFSFTGWNTAANGSGTAYAAGASYPFTASATLFAQWTQSVSTTTTTVAPAKTALVIPRRGGPGPLRLAKELKMTVPNGATGKIVVASKSKSFCTVNPAANLVSLKKGQCTVTVTVTPSKGKATSKTGTFDSL